MRQVHYWHCDNRILYIPDYTYKLKSSIVFIADRSRWILCRIWDILFNLENDLVKIKLTVSHCSIMHHVTKLICGRLLLFQSIWIESARLYNSLCKFFWGKSQKHHRSMYMFYLRKAMMIKKCPMDTFHLLVFVEGIRSILFCRHSAGETYESKPYGHIYYYRSELFYFVLLITLVSYINCVFPSSQRWEEAATSLNCWDKKHCC